MHDRELLFEYPDIGGPLEMWLAKKESVDKSLLSDTNVSNWYKLFFWYINDSSNKLCYAKWKE